MRNFFASLRSSHALRWLLIWGVVILLVILLLRYISQKHAAANGMTTSGSGLGGSSDGSGGGSGGFGSSTNINISITDAISNAFAALRRKPPTPTPTPTGGNAPGGVVSGSGSPVLRPMPPVQRPPAQRPPAPGTGGLHRQPPVHQTPPGHFRTMPPVRQQGHVGPPPVRPPVQSPPSGFKTKPAQRF